MLRLSQLQNFSHEVQALGIDSFLYREKHSEQAEWIAWSTTHKYQYPHAKMSTPQGKKAQL